MSTRTNTFSRLVALFLLYIFLVAVGFFVYAVIIGKPGVGERGATIAGILGWTATLYAPVAAFFIIDIWKDQVKHQKALDHLSNAYSLVGKFNTTLQRLRLDRNYSHLVRVYNKTMFPELQEYLLKLEIQFLDQVNTLINIYDDIQNELSLYKLALGDENLDFDKLTKDLFEIIYNLKNIYSKFIELHLDAKENGDSYVEMTRLREFNVLFYQLTGAEFNNRYKNYIINDNLEEIVFLSTNWINKTIKILKGAIIKMRNEL
ncbi:hypothetical protein [Acinetobacter baumannii]|uniref:hypothetical protein n=1 Tax=Acinetobacter baumannii TaxID=470 RepID=UPI0020C0B48A|nr:hypothetical protein [Acinetobacter baumannii]MCL6176983.1 hypothetical protein [Acinetobacter baumannii]MCL6180445.1 hypothetical protein [Acinetobacter baumannii]MCL6187239.1 hypothetical protein [Acinetobacter baumannii]MCL6208522.1 hypothetical protein [Acinetobacter baumannii]MCL6211980.1 hypothetical protein [Acinetobacter baumannii]